VTEFLRLAGTIAAKDLRAEFRNKEVLNAAFSFMIVVLLLFSFAFDPITNPEVRDMAGGLLWIVYAFAAVLVLNRSFARETANECLDALVASPAPASTLFLGKCVANSALLLVLELISLPVFMVFYDVRWPEDFGELLLVFVLGTWALAAVGTMFSAITANNRLRELMLPLLVFPITLPALMACVDLTTLALAGEVPASAEVWWRLLIVFDLIFTLLGAVLLETVLVS
jgi:heme exporter protein B